MRRITWLDAQDYLAGCAGLPGWMRRITWLDAQDDEGLAAP